MNDLKYILIHNGLIFVTFEILKKLLIISIAFLLIAGIYLYIRFEYLKAKDFKPETRKEKNVLDLRPSIIAKLKQLVKNGSNGLYILSIDKMEPDVVNSKLTINNASLQVDTVVMNQFRQLKKLPDDLFNISFQSLHIDGIGITDLLHKDRIDLTNVFINNPVIRVYHELQPYNEHLRRQNDSLTLYKRLMKQMKSIVIGKIDIEHATFIDQVTSKKKQVTRFKDVYIRMNDIRVDSSTQFDQARFLFAKHAILGLDNFILPTPDSLYFFKAGSAIVEGEQHTITFRNTELKPRYSKEEFEKKVITRHELYNMVSHHIILSGVDWWSLLNKDKLIAQHAVFDGSNLSAYLDLSLPRRQNINMKNFPQQYLMKIPIPVSVAKVDLHHFNLSYSEYHRDIEKTGKVTFDDINCTITNMTNMPMEIRKHPLALVNGSCLFMNKAVFNGKFSFDLSKSSIGEFNADLHMGPIDKDLVNPFAEIMGEFTVKSGQLQEGSAQVEGNNATIKGTVSMKYTDLAITPLKERKGAEGNQKKKHVQGFIANTFLIKKSNPEKGNLREPSFNVDRNHHANFFNFVWISVMTGILKTVGIPSKFVIK